MAFKISRNRQFLSVENIQVVRDERMEVDKRRDNSAIKLMSRSKRFRKVFSLLKNWGNEEDARRFFQRLDMLQKSAVVSLGLRSEKVFEKGGIRILPQYMNEDNVIATLKPRRMLVPGTVKSKKIVFFTDGNSLELLLSHWKELNEPIEDIASKPCFSLADTTESFYRAFMSLQKNGKLEGCAVQHFVNHRGFTRLLVKRLKKTSAPRDYNRRWQRDVTDSKVNTYWGEDYQPLSCNKKEFSVMLREKLKLISGGISMSDIARYPALRYVIRQRLIEMLHRSEHVNLVCQLTLLAFKRNTEYSLYGDLPELASLVVVAGDRNLLALFERMFPSAEGLRRRVSIEVFPLEEHVYFPYSPYFICLIMGKTHKNWLSRFASKERIDMKFLSKTACQYTKRNKIPRELLCKVCKRSLEHTYFESDVFGHY